jgi:hypothetical protein
MKTCNSLSVVWCNDHVDMHMLDNENGECELIIFEMSHSRVFMMNFFFSTVLGYGIRKPCNFCICFLIYQCDTPSSDSSLNDVRKKIQDAVTRNKNTYGLCLPVTSVVVFRELFL